MFVALCNPHLLSRLRCLGCGLTLLCGLLLAHAAPAAQAAEVILDGEKLGRMFDGVGAVSAGASSRLLIDYPEPQRSEILDYLFKPGFGASFHRLKVEIGGEINSTDGTEPTHMRSAQDQNYHRGYEWWLMVEAKKRNPAIVLDCLAWGAPGWIGQGQYFSQDMADYIANFLEGAKREHQLDIEYTGVINERPNDVAWIKLLRRTLDARGLQRVKIVGGDEVADWRIANQILADPELASAVAVIGSHYNGYQSTAAAIQTGKPLWSSEDGPWGGTWDSSRIMLQLINRNYITGQMTATEFWSLVSSYYDVLPLPDSGPMLARQPWSGHYEVQPAIWALAHIGQFAAPGWKYLAGNACALLPEGGSYTSLQAPNGRDFTILVETFGAKNPQTLQFLITNGLSTGPVQIWRSVEGDYFKETVRLLNTGGAFSQTFAPNAIYTLTTTSGQQKGAHPAPPAAHSFPLPYVENFERGALHTTPRYLSDQAGTFEVVARSDGQGQALRQLNTQRGIEWATQFSPYTVAGDGRWTDYEVALETLLEVEGFISVFGRIGKVIGFSDAAPFGYHARLSSDGFWELLRKNDPIRTGTTAFPIGQWHQIRFAFRGAQIQLWLNGALLTEVTDGAYPAGLAGFGCGWHGAQFDNVTVRALRSTPNLALTAQMTASSSWSEAFAPGHANDNDLGTTWVSAFGTQDGEWLELTFPAPVAFDRAVVWGDENRIKTGTWQYWNTDHWRTLVTGLSFSAQRAVSFPSVTSSRARMIVNTAQYSSIIREVQLFQEQPPGAVRINEWMMRNTATVPDPFDREFEPWFELFNAGASTFDLAGHTLTDDPRQPAKFAIPSGFRLPPGGFLRVWADQEPGQSTPASQDLHVNFGLSPGKVIGLFGPGGQAVDLVELFQQEPDRSSGANPDGALAISPLAKATPGWPNAPFEALSIRPRSGGGWIISFLANPNTQYRLQSNTGLAPSAWVDAHTARSDSSGRVEFTDTPDPGATRFYRARTF